MTTLLMTQAMNCRKARATNATDTSFPSRIPTATEPTGDGVIDLLNHNAADGQVQNAAILVPYGTGDDNDVFAMRVIGWQKLPRGSSNFDLWVPVKLVELTCTMGTMVGVAGTPIAATERFCDTLALVGTSGNDDVSIDLVSPADNTIAHIVVDLKGAQKLELTFDQDAGTAPTNFNCLVRLI